MKLPRLSPVLPPVTYSYVLAVVAVLIVPPGCATTSPSSAGRAAPGQRSPGGRHALAVRAGAVLIDGRRVHGAAATMMTGPSWREDDDAVAWVERSAGGAMQLVVLPRLSMGAQPLEWPLPRLEADDRVHWAARTRVVVGPELLTPRASVSWTEE